MALSIKRLKSGGRGVIVLPDSFLSGNENAEIAIKTKLLKECNLHTIIRLPQSCFSPYTSIATNLLFFDKGEPTQEIWFYRLDMPEGYKHFSKTKPMKREHFACVDEWWNNREEIIDEKDDASKNTTYKSKKYTIDEIVKGNYDLDLCGYPVEEKTVLTPAETIHNYIEQKRKLEKQLTQATDNMRAFLMGNESVSLMNIKSLSDRIGQLDASFPGDMIVALIQAAMQGKLTEQFSDDGSADELLNSIKQEKERLVGEKAIKKEKPLDPIPPEKIPFDIPDNWRWCRLPEIAVSGLGKTLNGTKDVGEDKPYLCSINVYWAGISTDVVKRAKFSESDISKYSLQRGDLLICEGGDVGRSAIWNSDEEMYYQNALHRVRFFGGILPEYIKSILYYYKVTGTIDDVSKGMTIKHLVQSSLYELVFPIPPIAEQRRIVEKLDKLLPLCDSAPMDS